jgi:hypothetical protein
VDKLACHHLVHELSLPNVVVMHACTQLSEYD